MCMFLHKYEVNELILVGIAVNGLVDSCEFFDPFGRSSTLPKYPKEIKRGGELE